jgi:hypothetical protein
MIYYICHRKYAYTLAVFFRYFRNDLADRLRFLSYDAFFQMNEIDTGVFVFTDFDRLDSEQMRRAKKRANLLDRADTSNVILNDPNRFLGRFDLLQTLHARDPQAPATQRLVDWKQVKDFPVFIRGERDHLAALSGLIDTATALETTAKRLLNEHSNIDDVMIIQFQNQPNDAGFYEKYGAFRVGDTIYGQHLFQHQNWWVKENAADWSNLQRARHFDYIDKNPHADLLMPIFKAAGIEYGRIDYGLMEGRVVVFEINTNPVVNSRPPLPHLGYDAQKYADLHNAAMLTLPQVTPKSIKLDDVTTASRGSMTVQKAHRNALARVRWRIIRRGSASLVKNVIKSIRGSRKIG